MKVLHFHMKTDTNIAKGTFELAPRHCALTWMLAFIHSTGSHHGQKTRHKDNHHATRPTGAMDPKTTVLDRKTAETAAISTQMLAKGLLHDCNGAPGGRQFKQPWL